MSIDSFKAAGVVAGCGGVAGSRAPFDTDWAGPFAQVEGEGETQHQADGPTFGKREIIYRVSIRVWRSGADVDGRGASSGDHRGLE